MSINEQFSEDPKKVVVKSLSNIEITTYINTILIPQNKIIEDLLNKIEDLLNKIEKLEKETEKEKENENEIVAQVIKRLERIELLCKFKDISD